MAGGSVDAMPVKVCGICRQEVPWSDWTEHVAQHSRDRRNSSSPDWRQIRQAIYVRDGGRCTHVDQNGHRCPATQELAVHHIDGDRRNDDPENLRLVCPQHPAGLGPPAWFAPDVRCGGRPSSARSCPVVEQLEGRLHAVGEELIGYVAVCQRPGELQGARPSSPPAATCGGPRRPP